MTTILRTWELTKIYEDKEIVRSVNMEIKQGEIYGFLGPNGAGKTTVMKMITNLVKPTAGEIEFAGEKMTHRSYEMLKRMGSIIEYPVFYDKLSARENLALHGEYMGFYDTNAIEEALELVKLRGVDSKPVKNFSLGMKQRLGIARAVMTKPELLILDEPINGLDPLGIKELREVFRMLSRDYGMTLLISSHILGEIEQIADTIGVIREGVLVEQVAMDTIRSQHTQYIELVTSECTKAVFILEGKLGLRNYKVLDPRTIRVYEDISQLELSRALSAAEVELESMSKKHHSLEDHFMELMGASSMLKLIRLELRKSKFTFLKGVLIANLAILVLMFLISFTGLNEGDFATYSDLFQGVSVFVKATYIIFASVLISKLVIEEYKNNTITVLFMYPVPRKMLMAAKLIIVFLFTFLSIWLSTIVISGILAGVGYFLPDLIQGTLTMDLVLTHSMTAGMDALYASGIALIPLYFGMRRKSVTTTIVSAVLIVMLISSGFGNGSFRMGDLLGISITLALAGAVIAYLSIRNIEHQDVS